MNRKAALIAGIAAMVIGGVCVAVYVDRVEHELTGGAPVSVLVAVVDLPLGTSITEDMLALRELPQRFVEERHIPASDMQRVLGVRISSAVHSGEALLWTDLESSEQRRDLSAIVESGHRAVTIEAGTTASFGGLLRPGDRVDVIHTVRVVGSNEQEEHVSTTILQNVLVLATGRDTGGRYGEDPNRARFDQITLSVDIDQSQLLAVASAAGRLTLALRHPDDIEQTRNLPARRSSDLRAVQTRSAGTQAGTGTDR